MPHHCHYGSNDAALLLVLARILSVQAIPSAFVVLIRTQLPAGFGNGQLYWNFQWPCHTLQIVLLSVVSRKLWATFCTHHNLQGWVQTPNRFCNLSWSWKFVFYAKVTVLTLSFLWSRLGFTERKSWIRDLAAIMTPAISKTVADVKNVAPESPFCTPGLIKYKRRTNPPERKHRSCTPPAPIRFSTVRSNLSHANPKPQDLAKKREYV